MHRRLQQIRWLTRRMSRISPKELPYRLRCLAVVAGTRAGIAAAHRPPHPDLSRQPRGKWVRLPPAPAALDALLARAESGLENRADLFGATVQLTAPPQWNSDPLSGTALPRTFGPALDFRHLAAGVDIKHVWEINRHLWLVPLAQAYALTRQERYLTHLKHLLTSWLEQCPYLTGANWSSPVEHGIRLINWSLIWQLIDGVEAPLFQGDDGKALLRSWLNSIYQHMHFIEQHYSRHSSADNHLIGEAAGVFVACCTWPYWKQCTTWRHTARRILEMELQRQFAEDGGNLEQAFCYHRFSLEFLILAGLCARATDSDFTPEFWRRMHLAAQFLAAMLPVDGDVPSIGDGDDGRVAGLEYRPDACPYRTVIAIVGHLTKDGGLLRKAASCGATPGWLIEPSATLPAITDTEPHFLPRYFPAGGYAILGHDLHTPRESRIVFDIGNLGLNRVAGHGHADALSVLVSHHGYPLLIDSGTYCYNVAPAFRRYFRSTRAHNTVCVDNQDQARYGGSFLWLSDVNATVEACTLSDLRDHIRASHDGYLRLSDPATHVRDVSFDKAKRHLHVEDRLECKGRHRITIYWHFHPACVLRFLPYGILATHGPVSLLLRCTTSAFDYRQVAGGPGPEGKVSMRFGHLCDAPTLSLTGIVNCHDRVVTSIQLYPN